MAGRLYLPGTISMVVALSLVALPAACICVVALAQWRRTRGIPLSDCWKTALADVAMVYGSAPWVYMTLLPGSGAGQVTPRVSLVPLRDLSAVLGSHPKTVAVQVVGNLCVLAALGFFAPLRFRALASAGRVLALATTVSVTLEAAQYALDLDRVSSVDDVLLNVTGAGLAALASRRWWNQLTTPDGHIARTAG